MSGCPLIDELQALNLIACEHVENGDVKEATEIYDSLLSKLESSCWLAPTPLASSSRFPQDQGASAIEVYCGIDKEDIPQGDSIEDNEENNDNALPEYTLDPKKIGFFSRPFNFECNSYRGETINMTRATAAAAAADAYDNADQLLTELTSAEYNIMAITSLFNLGLCHHLQWKTQQEQTRNNYKHAPSQDSLLFQALHCYEQAYSLTKHQLVPTMINKNKNNNKNTQSQWQYHYSIPRQEQWIKDHPVLQVVMAICANATHCQGELALGQVSDWNAKLFHLLGASSMSKLSNKRKDKERNMDMDNHVQGDADDTMRSNKRRRLSADASHAHVDVTTNCISDNNNNDDNDLSLPLQPEVEPRYDPCSDATINFMTMNAFFNSIPRNTALAA